MYSPGAPMSICSPTLAQQLKVLFAPRAVTPITLSKAAGHHGLNPVVSSMPPKLTPFPAAPNEIQPYSSFIKLKRASVPVL